MTEPDLNPEYERVVDVMLAALERARLTFERYERQHAEKGTPEGDQKALRNRMEAQSCSEAIAAWWDLDDN